MDKNFFSRAAGQALRAVAASALVCLFALSLAAVFVSAYALPQTAVTAIDWSVKCIAVFCSCALFIRGERALAKGAAAGVLSCIFTMLLFAMVGGGFHVDAFFLLELLICALLGAGGGIVGAKFHKA